MNRKPIERVLILGGGSAGLMTALAVKKRNPHLDVVLVRSPEIGIIQVGEGTFPHMPKFLHGYLNIDPAEFYREVRPTWKLGIRFLWGPRPEGFNYTFKTQFDSQYQALSKPTGFYCQSEIGYPDVATVLMHQDRALLAAPNGAPVVDENLAYHLENEAFVAYLEKHARECDVSFLEDTVEEVLTDESGVAGLRMKSGATLTAGLYADCSGFRSLLLGKTLGDEFDSYHTTLFCDQAVIGGWSRADEPIKPYTTAETMNAGWCWQVEHRDRINRGYVYSSSFISAEAAEREFREKNPKIGETRIVPFRSGIYRNPWTKNVVAVGNASGFVEPLESTSLGQIAQDAQGIAEILADSNCWLSETQAAQHNERFRRSWTCIRQFLALHYRYNTKLDTPFWRACQNDVDLAGAETFVDYFVENGPSTLWRMTLIDRFDQFNLDGYLAMMIGQNVPYENRFAIPPSEAEIWRKINLGNERRAMKSYTCAEGLKIVESPQWKWDPNFYQNAWSAIKPN